MNQFQKFAAIAVIAAVPGLSSAYTIYDTFGSFPDATWGGTGIPNDAVAAAKTIIDGDTTIRIAMNATGRYSNPQLSNDNAGRFFAGPGSNTGGNNESPNTGALWNFNYFMDIVSGSGKTLKDYQFDLWYEFDPTGPTACCSLPGGRWNLTNTILAGASPSANPLSTVEQDSQNLMFSFLATNIAGFITAPSGAFNPNALGNYQFALTVASGFTPLDSIAIEVNVVPVPAAVWLFGSALGLLGWVRRKAAA